jgi:hypothetical protein
MIEPKLYSIKDACFVLGGISRDYLDSLVASRDLVKIKMGRNSYICAQSIETFIAKLRQVAA